MKGPSVLRVLWACGQRSVLFAIVAALILVGQPVAVGRATRAFHGSDALQRSRQSSEATATSTSVDTRFATGQVGPWPVGHLALNGATSSLSHGYYVLSNQNGYSAMAFPKGATNLGDATISATFQLPTRGQVGVVARYTSIRDVVDYDDCWLDATGRVGCEIWENGSPSALLAPRTLGLSRNVAHRLMVSLHGSGFSVSVDGRHAYQGTVAHPLPTGQWGLYVIGKFSQGVVKGSFSRATITNAGATSARTPSPTHTTSPTATKRPTQRPTKTPTSTRTPLPTQTPVPTETMPPANTAQLVWTSRSSGTTQLLFGVNCPIAQECIAVGFAENATAEPNTFVPSGGIILHSEDGGITWSSTNSGTGNLLESVSCPSTSECVAVGFSIVTSRDGGMTWTLQTPGAGKFLADVTCPSVSECLAVGNSGTIERSDDGGLTWTAQISGTSQNLYRIDCPSTSECITVGQNGILSSEDGGMTWAIWNSGPGEYLGGISCPTANECVAVGANGTVLTSGDGGTTWTNRTSGTAAVLSAVSCPTASQCVIVGTNGTILTSEDGGTTWTVAVSGTIKTLFETSCFSVNECVAVGDHGTILTSGTGD
jgi:photosystem II stability/assembly factor-like uncharacterized protein